MNTPDFRQFLCCLLAACLSSSVALAQTVPALINYQGQISNPDGSLPPTADYELSFSIYDSDKGGALIWGPQKFSGSSGPGLGAKVPVVQGYFNVMLGPVDIASRSINTAFSNATRYVEIKLGANNPIAPRQQILSAPYALRAEVAAQAAQANLAADSQKLAGADWTAIFGANSPSGPIPASKLADGSLPGGKIQAGTITSNQIAARTISGSLISAAAVGSNEIAAGAVSGLHIGPGSVPLDRLVPRSQAPGGVGNVHFSATLSRKVFQAGNSQAIPELSLSFPATGRPVIVGLQSGFSPGAEAGLGLSDNVPGDPSNPSLSIILVRNSASIVGGGHNYSLSIGAGYGFVGLSPEFISIDFPDPGTVSYSITVNAAGVGDMGVLQGVRLFAFEL